MNCGPRYRNALSALAVILTLTGSGWCRQDMTAAADHFKDFIHYAIIARPDLAASHAKALVDTGIANAQLAEMVDESKESRQRFDDAIARAQRVPELEAAAADLAKRVETGRLDLARDPKRIEEAVQMLVGQQRARLLGKQRLIAAGEYAAPALLKQITEGRDEQLKLASQETLVQIGRPAVTPLSIAVLDLTGVSQRVVCDILGTIKHPHAAPYLREVSQSAASDGPAREAAERAFRALGVADASLSSLYADLARRYFDGHEALVAFPEEDLNNVWSYDAHVGLSPTPVPTPIYAEVMAVKTSSKALQLDAANTSALSLFVASNLKRENDLPEGAADPVYGENQYSPEFYATVFGTQTCLDVLGLAIDKLDTTLVRDAINALSKTTGGANLFTRGQGRQPLLEALTYPDRRVQYEAALTLGRALPQQKFQGDQAVVPILASAVRTGNQSLAIVIAENKEDRQTYTANLEQAGFQIIANGATPTDLQDDIARAVGVDLVLIRGRDATSAVQAVNALRAIPKTAAAPSLVVVGGSDRVGVNEKFRDDPRVQTHVAAAAGGQAEFADAVEGLLKRASGGRITEAEAEEYAIRSLSVLRDVAISRSPAYTIADAESALIDALDTRSGGTRMLVADILALIDKDPAQQKLFDAALAASVEEQVELLNRVADSVRLWGDHAQERHVKAIVDLVANSSGPTAEAAATVHGALNLPTSDAVKLIPQP